MNSAPKLFQFQLGAIKGSFAGTSTEFKAGFQFQLGAIKGELFRVSKNQIVLFQFQLGAIKGPGHLGG